MLDFGIQTFTRILLLIKGVLKSKYKNFIKDILYGYFNGTIYYVDKAGRVTICVVLLDI